MTKVHIVRGEYELVEYHLPWKPGPDQSAFMMPDSKRPAIIPLHSVRQFMGQNVPRFAASSNHRLVVEKNGAPGSPVNRDHSRCLQMVLEAAKAPGAA